MSTYLVPVETRSPHSQIVALMLCWFLGIFGIHRFYVGKFGTGLLQLFTLGGFGIWSFIDLIILAMGKFRDADNRVLGPPQMEVRRLEPPQRPIPIPRITNNVSSTFARTQPAQPAYDDAELMRDPLEDEFAQLEKDLRDGSL